MAFVAPGAGDVLTLSAKFVDDELNTAVREFYVDFNTSLTQTVTDAISILAALQPLTAANLSEATITLTLTDSAAPVATADQPVSANAILSAELDTSFAGNPNYQSISIPAPIDALFLPVVSGQKLQVDTSNAALGTFLGLLETGGPGRFKAGQINPTGSLYGTKRYRKSNQ